MPLKKNYKIYYNNESFKFTYNPRSGQAQRILTGNLR